MVKSLGFAGLFGLSLLLLAGCAPKDVVTLKRDAPAVPPTPGWSVREGEGFSLMAPDSYQVPREAGMSAADLQNLSNPGVGYGLSGGKDSTTSEAKMVLSDRNFRPIPGEPNTGLTVNVETRMGGAGLEGEMNKVKEEFIKEEVEKIELPVGPAYQVTARLGLATGDRVDVIVFVICDGEKVYRLRFETTNGKDAIAQVARPVADSFRVM